MKGFVYGIITLILSHQTFGGKIEKNILKTLEAHDEDMQSSVQANLQGIESNGKNLTVIDHHLEKMSNETADIVGDAVNAINEKVSLTAADLKTEIQANLDTIQDLAGQLDSHDDSMKARVDDNLLEIEANGGKLTTINSQIQTNQAAIQVNNDKLTALGAIINSHDSAMKSRVDKNLLEIEEYGGKISTIDSKVQANQAAIQANNDKLTALDESMKKVLRRVGQCDLGVEHLTNDIFWANGKCYYFERTKYRYHDHIRNCKQLFGESAKLAEPMTQEENEIICTLTGGGYWLGINDRRDDNSQFLYESSMKPVIFTNWKPGQPDGQNSTSYDLDCVFTGSNCFWYDYFCNNRELGAICQF